MRLFKTESELDITSATEVTEVIVDNVRWIPMMTSPQQDDLPYCADEIFLDGNVYKFHDYGNSNLVYVCSETSMALKIPIPKDTRLENLQPISASDNPVNAVIKWNEIYPEFKAELASINDYQTWLVPFFHGETATAQDVCIEILRLYQKFNLIILDAHILRNFVKMNDITICIDIGEAKEITTEDNNLFTDENELDNSEPNILTMQQAILCLSCYQIDFDRFPKINIENSVHWDGIRMLAKAYLDQNNALDIDNMASLFTEYYISQSLFAP